MASVTPPLGGPPYASLGARALDNDATAAAVAAIGALAAAHVPHSSVCSRSCRRSSVDRRRRARRSLLLRPPRWSTSPPPPQSWRWTALASPLRQPTALSSGGGTVASTAAASAAAAATVGATAPLQPALTPRRNLWHSKVTSMKAVAALRKLPGRELTTAPDPIGDSPSPTAATHDRDGRRDSRGRRPSPLHRPSLLRRRRPGCRGAAARRRPPSTRASEEERCRRCLAAAVEPSLLRETGMGRRPEARRRRPRRRDRELATTLEDERPAATRADTAAAAAPAHDAQARRGDVVDAAVTWSKKQNPASEELQQLIASVDAHYDGWVASVPLASRALDIPFDPKIALLSAAVGRAPARPPSGTVLPKSNGTRRRGTHHRARRGAGRRGDRGARDGSARRFRRAPRRDPRGRRRGGGDGAPRRPRRRRRRRNTKTFYEAAAAATAATAAAGPGVPRLDSSTCSSVPMGGAHRERGAAAAPSPTKLLDGSAGLESVDEGGGGGARRRLTASAAPCVLGGGGGGEGAVARRGGSRRRCVLSTVSRGRACGLLP